jgi:putative ABC transport system permease protein
MIPIPELVRRLWYMIRRERYVSELEEELRLHVQLRAEAMQAAGLTAEQASAEARRRFGNVTNTTEASREVWGFGTLDQLLQDVRFAARRLRARPGLSAPVIVVLALGIGATTAVFSAVDAAMLRSLPFPRDHELVTLTNVNVPFALEGGERNQGRLLDLSDVAAMTDVFSGVAAYASGGLNLSDPDRPQRVSAGVVTTGFFETLGATPLAGRVFTAEEGVPNGPPAVILSHALWRRQFGGAPMVGKSIPLHGRPHTVVGIMRPGFDFPGESDLWIPMSVPTTFATFEPFRGFLPSHVVARMRPGFPVEAAGAQVLSRWLQVAQPARGERRANLDQWIDEVRAKGAAVPLHRQLLGDRRTALLVLLGTTALLLMIACANVANLLLSDAAMRRREIAVREALGATRLRIVRQLLAESALLAAAGAIVGILLAPALLTVLRAMLPASLAGVAPAQLDLRVLGFAAALAITTSIVFGLWPAIGATRGDASDAIKSGGGHGATAGVGRVRRALVVVEVALTAMLLIAAGLMLRSFDRLMGEKTGMNPSQVATLETSFPRNTSEGERDRILNGVIDRLSGQPGIVAAGAVNDLPLRGGGGISVTIDVPGAPALKPDEARMARILYASSDYFAAMGIERLRGRTFTSSDANGPQVAIISNAMAEEYWPGVDPVGRYVTYRGDTSRITVVGVVADVRESALDRDPIPQMYQPIDAGAPNAAIVVRGTLPPARLIARLTDAMRAVAPAQAVYNVRTMEEVVGASVLPRRTNTILIALFATLALVLSALGVYAVVAYGVAQRARELGIRAALGATGRDLLMLVSGEMVRIVALGIAIGLVGAWGLSRVLSSLLYEVDPRDPTTFVVVPLVLVLPAVVATIVPALRGARVSPTEVMRLD